MHDVQHENVLGKANLKTSEKYFLQFEGEAFYDSRRERRRVNNNLDYFMKETRTGGFDHSQRYKQRSTSTTAEERRSKQARWERKQATGGGGGKLFLVALLVFVAFIKMRS